MPSRLKRLLIFVSATTLGVTSLTTYKATQSRYRRRKESQRSDEELQSPTLDMMTGPTPALSAFSLRPVSDILDSVIRELLEQQESSRLNSDWRYSDDVVPQSGANELDAILTRLTKKSDYNGDMVRMKTILANVIYSEHKARLMAHPGIKVALLRLFAVYRNDQQFSALLLRILANFTVYPSTRSLVLDDCWVSFLARCSTSSELDISLPAVKALANLSDHSVKMNGIYGNNLYLLSPTFLEKFEPKCDVVFVHGLMGSTFKSWRQGSLSPEKFGQRWNARNNQLSPPALSSDVQLDNRMGNTENQSAPSQTKTNCWPRDWLAEDVVGMRILAVDYPSALSSRLADCDLDKNTLKERATLLMSQLEAANLGNRPIIWVAHSMGGLLVKQILVVCGEQASTSQFKDNIIRQTKGIVFYGVPHKGSNFDWIEREHLQKLLKLTTEVIELQKDSPNLIDLHERFLSLVNSRAGHIKFLTYAEDSTSIFGVNKIVKWEGILVHEDSLQFELGPNIKLNMDHKDTCKPRSKEDITYVNTLNFIKDLTKPYKKDDYKDEELLPYLSFVL